MKQNKFLLFLVLAILLFSFLSSFTLAAERRLEVEYPKVGEEEITATTTLPEYVKYIFKFSLIIAAVAAFAILILTTINPELISLKEPEIKPSVGIYLVNAKDEKLYLIQDTPKITQEFEQPPFGANRVVFLSPKPADQNFADPDKLELAAIFIYPEENWKGNPKKVENNGATSTLPFSSPKSLKFLLHKPGIYLYKEETGWETDSWPLLFQSSHGNLGEFDFNDKAKSLKIVNPCSSPPCSPGAFDCYAALFEHISFNRRVSIWSASGKCQFFLDTSADLDSYGYVKDKVSSIAVFRSAPIHGEIIFYEKKGCTGEAKYTEQVSGDPAGFTTLSKTTGLDSWNSIYIDANATLVLNTEEDASGYCAAWSGRQCIPDLEGTTVYSYPGYDSTLKGYKPVRAAWFPLQE